MGVGGAVCMLCCTSEQGVIFSFFKFLFSFFYVAILRSTKLKGLKAKVKNKENMHKTKKIETTWIISISKKIRNIRSMKPLKTFKSLTLFIMKIKGIPSNLFIYLLFIRKKYSYKPILFLSFFFEKSYTFDCNYKLI